MFSIKFIARLLTVGMVVLAFSSLGLWAQGRSTIAGTIVDVTGGVVPGVEVTVTSVTTGDSRTVLTGDTGTYRVTNLIPGRYEVKASMVGFKTAVGEVTVTVLEVAHVQLTLEVGLVTEVVTVLEAATTVDVEKSTLSGMVDERRIADLPLNGRNIYQLMQTAPGAVNTESTITEPGQNTNVNGGRANMNGFWMDGITIKGLSGGTGAGDGPGMVPNLEGIQEFRIETLNFSAEFGNSVGSIVNVVTKSGGNAFHGSVFEFHRNDNVDAREIFDESIPEFKQNQFGFSLGGPIVEDKTFFFGSYEGTRIRTGESEVATFESPEWANFVKSFGAPVNQFLFTNMPAPTITTVSTTVGQYLSDFGYIGSIDQASVDAFLGGTFGSPPGAIAAGAPMVGETGFFTPDASEWDGFSVRLDQEFGDNDKLYGRYFLTDGEGLQIADPRPAFNAPFFNRSHLVAINWTHVFSPNTINEARTGLTRQLTDILAGTPGVPWINETGSGLHAIGTYNGYPQIFHENVFTWADTLSITAGDHGMKMGGEVRRNQENSEFDVGRPSYYFFDLIYLALDDPYYQISGVDPNFDEGPGHAQVASNFRGWRNTEIGIFFNDDWKIRPNLTLNLGVRWDFYSRLTEVQNRATKFDLTLGGSNFVERVRNGEFVGPVDKLSGDDWNNIAPRVGFAWDPFSDGKMSIRGGYGIAYQSGIFNPLANSRWNKPFYSFNLICDVCGRAGENILYGPQDGSAVRADGANNNPGGQLKDGNIIAYDPFNVNKAFLSGIANPDMRDPYVQSFFLGVQREVARSTTVEINYVATLGRKLIRAENPNRFTGDRIGAPSPVGGEFAGDNAFNRLNPNEGTLRFWENNVNSNYHSLQLQFNRIYSGGFAFNANYTWAKSLDTRSTWHSGATSANKGQEGYSTDFSNVGLDYGRSIFDSRHRFVFSSLWEAPWFKDSDSWLLKNVLGGWQFNGVGAIQAGQPFTPHCNRSFPAGCDWNADGNNNDRPNTPSIGNNFSSTERSDYLNPNSGPFNISGSSTGEKLAFFGEPVPGTNGTLGRNTYEGPGFANVDFSIFKEIGLPQLGESGMLQFRAEFFNLFNRVNLFQPAPRINDSKFGRGTEAFDAREIQF
ncbi:TonB-dependent receptor, partial [Acidobacteria bacterium AH-259-A15]|nr:TonB-dependent receptor [Acidobacteria bacterium AH-259-A15]